MSSADLGAGGRLAPIQGRLWVRPRREAQKEASAFMKRPLVVEAERLDQDVTVETLEGAMHGSAGDWLVTGIAGEKYVVAESIFLETFEPASAAALEAWRAAYGEDEYGVEKEDVAELEHTRVFAGVPVVVDRPQGFVQTGVGADGKPWERTYLVDYGYLPGTEGGDEEGVDVFLGPDEAAPVAWWVAQLNGDGEFDEFKVMLGCRTAEEAKALYEAHIPPRFFAGIYPMPMEMLRAVVGSDPAPTEPFFLLEPGGRVLVGQEPGEDGSIVLDEPETYESAGRAAAVLRELLANKYIQADDNHDMSALVAAVDAEKGLFFSTPREAELLEAFRDPVARHALKGAGIPYMIALSDGVEARDVFAKAGHLVTIDGAPRTLLCMSAVPTDPRLHLVSKASGIIVPPPVVSTPGSRALTDADDEQGVRTEAAAAVNQQGEVRAKAERYASIDFAPPDGVRAAAQRGLELHAQGYTGDGLKPETVAWAGRVADGKAITPEKARAGAAWHARHAVDRRANWDNPPTPGYAAYMLWFGAAGEAWFGKLVEQMDAEDRQTSKAASPVLGPDDRRFPAGSASADGGLEVPVPEREKAAPPVEIVGASPAVPGVASGTVCAECDGDGTLAHGDGRGVILCPVCGGVGGSDPAAVAKARQFSANYAVALGIPGGVGRVKHAMKAIVGYDGPTPPLPVAMQDHAAVTAPFSGSYEHPEQVGGWLGWIEPEDAAWIAFVDTAGKALLWDHRDEKGGVAGTPYLFSRPDLTSVGQVPMSAHLEKMFADMSLAAKAHGVTTSLARRFTIKADTTPGTPEAPEELRYALGIVLEPEPFNGAGDSQGDTYSADEIRKAEWIYMMHFRNIGLQHKTFVNGRIHLVESYLAPTDLVIDGEPIQQGTWLMGLYVPDDALWEAIRKGELTGLSIAGIVQAVPIEA